jgi:hypothetical protein
MNLDDLEKDIEIAKEDLVSAMIIVKLMKSQAAINNYLMKYQQVCYLENKYDSIIYYAGH